MSSVKKNFVKQLNLSSGVLDLIMKPWSEVMAKRYAPHLRMLGFCSENGLQPIDADVTNGGEFLIQYFRKSSWIFFSHYSSFGLLSNVQRKANFPTLHCYMKCQVCSRLCRKVFYFQWNIIWIIFKNFGNYDVSLKWTNITNFSLFIHRSYVPQ